MTSPLNCTADETHIKEEFANLSDVPEFSTDDMKTVWENCDGSCAENAICL